MAIETPAESAEEQRRLSLSTAAARNLATTTKTAPQMQGITSRWVLRMLPWVQVSGGTYRVNRRLSYAVGRGRVGFSKTGDAVRVIPPSLREVPLLRDLTEDAVLQLLADRFVQREVGAGEVIVESGKPADQLILVAHGKVSRLGSAKYGDHTVLGVLADGDHFGEESLLRPESAWDFTARAVTRCVLLSLPRQAFQKLANDYELLLTQARLPEPDGRARNRHGEADIDVTSGHEQEEDVSGTFVDYEVSPREYQLSAAQTVLRVHTRVADLYNEPMNQVEQQLRLTVEALRERQEYEMVNDREFGLLHNADFDQRIQTHHGPPTPDDLDDLLCRRRKTQLMFAHPRTIAAIGREWNRRGLYPDAAEIDGHRVPAWRGVPILPCSKIPITDGHTSSIIAMRTGEENQGVVGLHQLGIPDEYQPSLSVRFMGIDEKAIISYLVTAYYSCAVLVPDALGILENVEIARPRD